MKQVFRVETEDGTGLYSSFTSTFLFETETRHPSPHNDPRLGDNWRKMLDGEIFFGFVSPEQLRFWIYKTEWREALHKENFRVSIYEVADEDCVQGDTQAIFVKDRARLVCRKYITDI